MKFVLKAAQDIWDGIMTVIYEVPFLMFVAGVLVGLSF